MKIKAYAWDDEDYGRSDFVWTTTPGKAKALLAAEYDREFTEIRVYGRGFYAGCRSWHCNCKVTKQKDCQRSAVFLF